MRKVKCFICKKESNNLVAFKTPQNKYCCSEDEYNEHISKLNSWNELYDYIKSEIFEYDKTQNLSHWMIKQLRILNQAYSSDIILETVKQCKTNIKYYLTVKKELDNEYKKINYMLAIIKNKINDIYEDYITLEKRKKIKEPEVNYIDLESSQKVIKTIKDKGILEFIEGEID